MERSRTETIREFILDLAAADARGIARRVAEVYGISRQAANRHLDLLVKAGLLEQSGKTRARVYRLKRTSSLTREFRVTPVLKPDRVWEDHIAAIVSGDRPGVRDLCRGAFGELIRNAVTHARASWITVAFSSTARDIALRVSDDGRGLLAAIAPRLGAPSPRDAAETMARLARTRAVDSPTARLVLLARNFDAFDVRANGFRVAFDRESGVWSVSEDESAKPGTSVAFSMRRVPGTAASAPSAQERIASAG